MPFTEDEFRNWWAAQRRAADDAIVEDGIPRTPGNAGSMEPDPPKI